MKRFTETQKWDDPWFRKLTPEMKLLWQWLLDRCDNAGVINPDLELASFQIGYQYPMDSLSEFSGRVDAIGGGKFFIPKFIEFQYGRLSEDCKAHRPVFQSLEKHKIKGYSKGIYTLKEKEKEKDTETEKDKPLSPLQIRIGSFLNRRESTKWSDKELKALKAIGQPDEEDLALVERFYLAILPKESDFRRTSIQTLLNNWPGEVDKARLWESSEEKPQQSRGW